MPATWSRAARTCISEVPGLAKQTATPFAVSVASRLYAPFMETVCAVHAGSRRYWVTTSKLILLRVHGDPHGRRLAAVPLARSPRRGISYSR